MSACVPVCGLWAVSCEVPIVHEWTSKHADAEGLVFWEGGGLNRTMRLKKISLFFPFCVSFSRSCVRRQSAKCESFNARGLWSLGIFERFFGLDGDV